MTMHPVTRSSAFGTLCIAALGVGVLACGGAAGSDPATPATAGAPNSAPIASMPAHPDPSQKKAAVPAAAAPPKDVKTICASASPIMMSSASPTRGWLEPDKEPVASGADRIKAKGGTYSMADLQALAAKGSWEELLGRAEDVAPAQRGADWNKLLDRAASGYMKQLTSNTAAFEGVFTSRELLKRYPQLVKSQEFMTTRGEAGKAASAVCLRESYRGKHCVEMMKEFLTTSNTGADVGFAFGKIARKNLNHYAAVPFFKWALDQKKDGQMCADEDLKLAVVAGLGLKPADEDAAGARHIATDACWDALKEGIKKELLENGGSYYRDNACAVLKAKGEL